MGRRLARVGQAAIRDGIPVLRPDATLRDALLELAASDLPMALVCEGRTLLGVLTPEDVRGTPPESFEGPVGAVMSRRPPVIQPQALIVEADRKLDAEGLVALVVVDTSGEVHGVYPRRRG